MQIIEDPGKMQQTALKLRADSKRIALISTSGSLHAGHAALIEKAKAVADIVVLTAFVNPIEFGPNEDYQRFPRNSSGDAEFCEQMKVDILFRPTADDLYTDAFSISISETTLSGGLCGISRPHYFRGVCTLHAILFNLIHPDSIVMGMRDAQKAAVIKRLSTQLWFQVDVHVIPIVREESGLACSARNIYLNEFQRKDAATLYKSLQEGKRLADSGITSVDRIIAEVTHHISLVRRLRVIYVVAVDPVTMVPVRAEIIPGKTLVVAAIWCDEVRLIDNIIV